MHLSRLAFAFSHHQQNGFRPPSYKHGGRAEANVAASPRLPGHVLSCMCYLDQTAEARSAVSEDELQEARRGHKERTLDWQVMAVWTEGSFASRSGASHQLLHYTLRHPTSTPQTCTQGGPPLRMRVPLPTRANGYATLQQL